MNTPLLAPRLLIVLALVLGAAPALAADSPAKRIWAPPRLALEGKSTGAAALTTQVGFAVAGGDFDVLPSLTYEIQSTNGIGTLLAVKESSADTTVATPRPWSLGATVNLRYWGKAAIPVDARAKHAVVLRNAYGVCIAQCPDQVPKDDGGTFCDSRKSRLEEQRRSWLDLQLSTMRPGDFCPEKAEAMEALDQRATQGVVNLDEANAARRDALQACLAPCAPTSVAGEKERSYCNSRPVPRFEADLAEFGADKLCKAGAAMALKAQKDDPRLVSHQRPFNANVGFQVGGTKFKHLGADAANAGQLVETTTLRTPWMIGGNLAWLPEAYGASWTVEGLLTHGVAYDGAEDTARYCVPAGDVTNGSGTVPATICKELGATGPTRVDRTRFGAYLGWFDAPGYVWRAALGFEHTISSGKHRTTVALPIYRLIGGTSDYKGMIRVAPGISFARDPSEATVYSVTISLLGQREFFSEKFDRL